MSTVNDFLSRDSFVIKDTKQGGKCIGLQINIWGETELSDQYGDREVIKSRMENDREIWGDFAMSGDSTLTLVLYI